MAAGKQAPISTVDMVDPFGDGSGIALYKFDGDATDESGTYNGTASNVTYGTGKFGQCAVFNGSSSYVSFGYNNIFNNMSVSFWFKANIVIEEFLFVIAGNVYRPLFMLEIDSSKHLNATLRNASATKTIIISTPYIIATNTFYHAVLCRNGSTFSFYVNGSLVGTNNTFEIGDFLSVPYAVIGHYPDGSLKFNGSIDQFRIFNKALTATEVTALYNEGQ